MHHVPACDISHSHASNHAGTSSYHNSGHLGSHPGGSHHHGSGHHHASNDPESNHQGSNHHKSHHHDESSDLGLMSTISSATTLAESKARASDTPRASSTTKATAPGRAQVYGTAPRMTSTADATSNETVRRRQKTSRGGAVCGFLCGFLFSAACTASIFFGFAKIVIRSKRGYYKLDKDQLPWYCNAQLDPNPTLQAHREMYCNDDSIRVEDVNKEGAVMFGLIVLFILGLVFALVTFTLFVGLIESVVPANDGNNQVEDKAAEKV